MKVVHIGYKYGLNNTGGAAIAATRLHKALLEHGVESHYVCIWKCEEGKNVHVLPELGGLRRNLYLILTKALRYIWKFTSYKRLISLHLVPLFGLAKLLSDINPEILHIQWINHDVLSFGQMNRINSRVILNLHDLYMINIMQPYPGPDKRYIEGVTRKNTSWLERWLFNQKRKSIAKMRPTIIGPSEWVIKCARQSIIGKGLNALPISNLFDDAYSYDEQLREEHEIFRLLFGAYGGRKNPSKGFADLEKVLAYVPQSMRQNMELWIFGESAPDQVICGICTRFKGNVAKSADLKRLYHQADVFFFPSVQETQGMTKIEAMLCGLPVLAFNRTACAEGIINGISGYYVEDGDMAGLASKLSELYLNFSRSTHSERIEFHGKIALKAKSLYDNSKILDDIVDVYKAANNDAEPTNDI